MTRTIRRGLAIRTAVWLAAGLCAAAQAAAVAETEPGAEETESAAPSDEMAHPDADESPQGSVARGVFTTAIVDREPTDRVDTLGNDTRRIYYFTELEDLDGRAVTHRWEHEGETRAEVEFIVGGPRWRVYSSKNLDPAWLGEWVVSVVDEQGNVLRQDRFVYIAEETEAVPAESPEPAGDVEGASPEPAGAP